MRVRFHTRASQELDRAIAHYEQIVSGLGLELEEEIEGVVALIRANPAIGATYKNTSFRYFVLKRFPYVVYYQELEQVIWIPAFAHGRRRLGYWRRRRFEG